MLPDMEINDSKVVMKCKICSKDDPLYKCPKCFISYCSLNCFKDAKHAKCTEKFYEEQVRSHLQSEKVSELSDEREKMIEILKRLETLSTTESSSIKDEDSEDLLDQEDVLDNFVNLDLNSLSCEEIEDLLGPKHLEKLDELIKSGVSTEWLSAILDERSKLGKDKPWFTRFKPSSLILNEDLPDFVPKLLLENLPKLKLTKVSDFLWNNLMEILVIYSFLYHQFPVEDFEDTEVVNGEILPCLFELSSVLNMNVNHPNGSSISTITTPFYYQSAIEAIDSAQSAIFMNSPLSGNSDACVKELETVVFEGVRLILSHPKMILLTLSDIHSWLKNCCKSNNANSTDLYDNTTSFFARKKILFFYAWIERELETNGASMDEILKTLILILENKA